VKIGPSGNEVFLRLLVQRTVSSILATADWENDPGLRRGGGLCGVRLMKAASLLCCRQRPQSRLFLHPVTAGFCGIPCASECRDTSDVRQTFVRCGLMVGAFLLATDLLAACHGAGSLGMVVELSGRTAGLAYGEAGGSVVRARSICRLEDWWPLPHDHVCSLRVVWPDSGGGIGTCGQRLVPTSHSPTLEGQPAVGLLLVF